MTVYAEHLSTEAQQFNWLLSQFAANTPEVIDAIAVSSDGLLIAMSHKLDRANADRLAAITSAMISLAQGAGRVYDLGAPNKVIIDLDGGYLLVSAISAGSALGVLADPLGEPGQPRLRDGRVRQPRRRGHLAAAHRGTEGLRRLLSRGTRGDASRPVGSTVDPARVPPYLLTGGRARPVDENLPSRRRSSPPWPAGRTCPILQFEVRDIVAAATTSPTPWSRWPQAGPAPRGGPGARRRPGSQRSPDGPAAPDRPVPPRRDHRKGHPWTGPARLSGRPAGHAIPVKIVIAGGFGVGKTTAVGAISEIDVLTTEAAMTEVAAEIDRTGHTPDKTLTTVALDFGRITIDDEIKLYLFGTPGQDRFGFMWRDLDRRRAGRTGHCGHSPARRLLSGGGLLREDRAAVRGGGEHVRRQARPRHWTTCGGRWRSARRRP